MDAGHPSRLSAACPPRQRRRSPRSTPSRWWLSHPWLRLSTCSSWSPFPSSSGRTGGDVARASHAEEGPQPSDPSSDPTWSCLQVVQVGSPASPEPARAATGEKSKSLEGCSLEQVSELGE